MTEYDNLASWVILTDYATQTTWPPSGATVPIKIMCKKISDAWAKQFKINFPLPKTKSKYGTTEERRIGDLKLITHTITVEGMIIDNSLGGGGTASAALQSLINTVRGGGFALLYVEGVYSTGNIQDTGVNGIWVNFNRFRWMKSPGDDRKEHEHFDITLEMIQGRSV